MFAAEMSDAGGLKDTKFRNRMSIPRSPIWLPDRDMDHAMGFAMAPMAPSVHALCVRPHALQ